MLGAHLARDLRHGQAAQLDRAPPTGTDRSQALALAEESRSTGRTASRVGSHAATDPECPVRSAVTAAARHRRRSSSARSRHTPPSSRPGWSGRPRRSRAGSPPSSSSPSSAGLGPRPWRPSYGPCGPRSARTSSTTASPPSRPSSAPTPTGPASCSSTSPTSPATPCAAGGPFTTLQEELRNVERYLVLEQARFGDRLEISLLIAPEVLPVAVPYLAVQPLVENAVRHGLAGKEGAGHLTITAIDRGAEAEIAIEDDGVGSDPEQIRRILDGAQRVRLGRPRQRRRAASPGLRRRLRARRRDRPRRRDEGHLPGAEVRAWRPSPARP